MARPAEDAAHGRQDRDGDGRDAARHFGGLWVPRARRRTRRLRRAAT